MIDRIALRALRVVPFALALAAAAAFAPVSAQTQQAAKPTAATSEPVLGIAQIESRMTAEGITIREIEIEGLAAEVEGYDAQGRRVELLIDRRSGEILSQKTKGKR